MSDFKPGLEGVVAFETEIAEPDKEGSALRYRGVDIEDLIGRVSFANVWALLVDGRFGPGLPPAEPFPVPVHSGDVRVDVVRGRHAGALLRPQAVGHLKRPATTRAGLGRASFVPSRLTVSACPVPQREIDKANTIVERSGSVGEQTHATSKVDAHFIAAASTMNTSHTA